MPRPTNPQLAARLLDALQHGAPAVLEILEPADRSDLKALPSELWQQLIALGQEAESPNDEIEIARAVAFIPSAVSDPKTREYLLSLDEGGVLEGLALHLHGRARDRAIQRLVNVHSEHAAHLLRHLLIAHGRRRKAAEKKECSSRRLSAQPK